MSCQLSSKAWACCLSLLSLAVVVGCGGSGGGYKVSGTVKYTDGTPVESATITFHPAGGGDVAPAGQVKNGQYTLKTEDKELAPAGKYKVTITPGMVGLDMSNPEAIGKMATKQPTPPTAAQFGDPAKTPLTAEITKDQSDLNFEVAKP